MNGSMMEEVGEDDVATCVGNSIVATSDDGDVLSEGKGICDVIEARGGNHGFGLVNDYQLRIVTPSSTSYPGLLSASVITGLSPPLPPLPFSPPMPHVVSQWWIVRSLI